MRELHYENQGINTYLVYEIAENDIVDSLSLGMLTNNKIHGLAQTLFTQMDAKKFIKYNVSAKVSVAQFFSGAVNKKRLLGVFSGITNAMLSAEDYMIDPSSIILDMNYIFTDVSTCETDLICLPISEASTEKVDLGLFFRNIMFSTQFDQTENCDHVAKIINYLNGTPMFSLVDFKKILDEIEEQKSNPIVPKPETEKPAQPVVKPPEKKSVQPAVSQTPSGQSKTTLPPASQVGGMAVPPATKKVDTPPVTTSDEPEISFFYLMQHYNKENAAAYKAQKERKKAAKGQTPQQVPVKKQTPPASSPATGFGFAVPGQVPPATAPVAQQVEQPKVSTQPNGSSTKPQQGVSSQPPAYVPREVPQGQAMNFGETTVLGGGAIGETTVLTAAQNPNKIIAPHLIRKKNNEKISLNKPVFRVGKERSYVDYFIGDNTAISRSHANFITREGTYFVVDTNSTNHTFVNGTMIQSNEEVAINHGDVIRLANEDFDFKLY